MFFQALIFCNINKVFQLSLYSIRIQFIVLIYLELIARTDLNPQLRIDCEEPARLKPSRQ